MPMNLHQALFCIEPVINQIEIQSIKDERLLTKFGICLSELRTVPLSLSLCVHDGGPEFELLKLYTSLSVKLSALMYL